MVRVRPPTLVGHPRTNHQSVMEYGRVRPAHLVGHPCSRSKSPIRSARRGCQERSRHRNATTSPPSRTYSSLASVSAEMTFYWACHFRFSLARKFPFLEIENPIAETRITDEERRL